MINKINSHYFDNKPLNGRENEILKKVTQDTNFRVENLIFSGKIYDNDKIYSLIYKGNWSSKPCVLKIQGLKPEISEYEMYTGFNKQNKSNQIRLPEILYYQPWDEKLGYEYIISEYIEQKPLFTMPFANQEEMDKYTKFFQEYRTKAITTSWIPEPNITSDSFTFAKIQNWLKISQSKGRLNPEDYAPFVHKYFSLTSEHLKSIPMIFCHRHLTANDIYVQKNGTYILLSNLFWSYQPQWYELGFNIWSCMQHIHDLTYTDEQLLEYIDKWLSKYKKTPIIEQDPDFDRKILVLLLERIIGAILVDIGVNDKFTPKNQTPYFKHLLKLHQNLFKNLAKKLENYSASSGLTP